MSEDAKHRNSIKSTRPSSGYQNYLMIIVGSSLAIFFAVVFMFVDSMRPSAECSEMKTMKSIELSGVILDSYYDRDNHGYETIKLKEKSGYERKIHLISEINGAFEFLYKGDSVYKPSNSLVIKIFRDGDIKEFSMGYDCFE